MGSRVMADNGVRLYLFLPYTKNPNKSSLTPLSGEALAHLNVDLVELLGAASGARLASI